LRVDLEVSEVGLAVGLEVYQFLWRVEGILIEIPLEIVIESLIDL
jgi:hypothetical protein